MNPIKAIAQALVRVSGVEEKIRELEARVAILEDEKVDAIKPPDSEVIVTGG